MFIELTAVMGDLKAKMILSVSLIESIQQAKNGGSIIIVSGWANTLKVEEDYQYVIDYLEVINN